MTEELEKDTPTAAVELEEIGECKRRIKFTVPFDAVEKEFASTYDKIKDSVQIPGFRPGKAPRHIVEMRMGKAFRETALSQIRERALGEAVVDHKLRPVSSPQFENVVYEKGKPFTFEATMEVIPEISLPEYKGIKIERKEAPTTTDAEVSDELNRIRERLARLGPAEDRPLRDGDVAVMTYEEEADGKSEKFEQEFVEIADNFVLPGFVQKVRGMRPGERREFEIRVPEDYRDKEAAGKAVSYRIHLDEVRAKVAPEADDELAKKIGFESVESLKSHIRTGITERREKEAEEDEVNQIALYLLRNTKFDVPESLLAEDAKRRMRRKVDVAHRARIPAEEIREKREELLRNSIVEAHADLKLQIIFGKIAELQGIEVSDDELETRLERIAQATNTDKEGLKKRYREEDRIDDIRYQILEQKVISFLHNSAIKE